MPSHSSRNGFSLIELLISVFILSIGLLAVAGLQLKSIKQNQSNYTRSQAILLASDIADRMRANIIGVKKGGYNHNTDTNENRNATDNEHCETETCTPDELASWDFYSWEQQLETPSVMPQGGSGKVRCVAPTTSIACSGTNCKIAAECTVEVTWNNQNHQPNANTAIMERQITLEFKL